MLSSRQILLNLKNLIMFLLKILLGLIIAFIVYKEIIKGRKTPNINVNSWKVINFLLWSAFIFLVPIIFFPEFWSRFLGNDKSGWIIAIIVIAVFMWKYHSFTGAVFIILILIGLVVVIFGDFSFFKEKKLVEAKIKVIETVNGKEIVIYEGLTPKTLDITNKFDVIPLTCGLTINVWSKGWGKGIDAKRDCSDVWVPLEGLPRTEAAVHFSTVEQ